MDKKIFRQKCLKRLRLESGKYNRAKDHRVLLQIDRIVSLHRPASILFYLPMPMEVDISELLRRYRGKYKIFVPFIVKESFKMVLYRLPLVRNRYNISEPRTSHLKSDNVDLIIVPVVGVDGACKRVGFGKGMYDRYFQSLKKRPGREPIVLFVQRVKCYTKSIVTDSFDMTADYYITPEETLYRGRNHDNRNRHTRGRRSGRCRRYSPARKPRA